MTRGAVNILRNCTKLDANGPTEMSHFNQLHVLHLGLKMREKMKNVKKKKTKLTNIQQ